MSIITACVVVLLASGTWRAGLIFVCGMAASWACTSMLHYYVDRTVQCLAIREALYHPVPDDDDRQKGEA